MHKRRLVVIGNGMAGARFVEELVNQGGNERFQITVFGEEPYGNYNRILLSGVLAGSQDANDILLNPLSWYAANDVLLHAGMRVDQIDLPSKRVVGTNGVVAPYDKLIIATGSRPLVPPISGLRSDNGQLKDGIFLFRTLDDCFQIRKYARQARRIAVIGGGLLGLEAARGLLNWGADVHVVHLRPYVMDTQLDRPGGEILLRKLERLGLQVHLDRVTDTVLGNDRVTGLAFRDGSTLECDMVVIAAGIRPNVELAERAGLAVGRAIVVGNSLACRNVANVYALGECAEHHGRLYGFVAPLWEQAQVLADRLSGRHPDALYRGSRVSTKLKVAGVDVAVMGEKDAVEKDDEVVSYAEPSRGVYKKLILRNDQLIGAIVIGDGAIVPALVHAFLESKQLPSTRAELLMTPAAESRSMTAEHIPDSAQICDCNAVTKAEIVQAVLEGARSVAAVSQVTRACTGCGSCKPEVEAIVELACQGVTSPEVLAKGQRRPEGVAGSTGSEVPGGPPNKIEQLKRDKDGLAILSEVPDLARAGWRAIEEGDRERLKWAGVFFRRQTPGSFMMRLRMSNGFGTSAQLRTIAEISRDSGNPFADITTRQQIQLRGFRIEDVPAIWERLAAVGLVSLQTGMDNIRNVIGCPMAGLTPHELFDASPVVHAFTAMFMGNKAFTNLPRKFNVAITGCTENCGHADAQDLSLTPASTTIGGRPVHGFNVAVGGKMGSGGCRLASPLNVFVTQEHAATLCSHIVQIFRDHGPRVARTRARLAFLIDDWGLERFRDELGRRVPYPLMKAGKDARTARHSDHLGIVSQRQPGLHSVGLLVPVGRITVDQLFEVARLAEVYGDGHVRITTGQNMIIPNVPNERVESLLVEPLLRQLSPSPHGIARGTVSCTGIDYCHFALIETKELALRLSKHLEQKLPPDRRLSVHWSGCPAGCGNHALADIGFVGKNIRQSGEVVDAVDVFVGGRTGTNAKSGDKVLEDVPCDELPHVLEQLVPMLPYFSKRKTASSTTTSSPSVSKEQLQANA